jgi:nucleoside-diphosphate-sugar epimerase
MRVFVTGATGFIGSAVVRELREAGHQVVGLARSDEAAATLVKWGAEAHRGELADTDGLAAGARASDGVIHLAFIHDFSKFEEAGETDRRAVEVMTDALAGSAKPLVVTSGTATPAPGRISTERDPAVTDGLRRVRGLSEVVTLAAADRGVRASVIRLPQVHDRSKQGFVTRIAAVARERGVSAFVGDGANRWPAVHRLDAARLFRLALERAEAASRLHAVAEEGIAFRTIAEAIGEGLGVPVRSIAEDEAAVHFGWLAHFAMLDNPTSSTLTRETMGWRPREIGLLAGIRERGYLS